MVNERMGQGAENSKQFLEDNPKALEIEDKTARSRMSLDFLIGSESGERSEVL